KHLQNPSNYCEIQMSDNNQARPVEVRGFGKWPVFLRTLFFACGIIWRGLRDRPRLVIVAHLNFAIVGWVLKMLTGTPYWCTAYGIEAWNIGRKVRSLGLRKANLVLAISNYTRRRVIAEQSIPARRVVILAPTLHGENFIATKKPDYLLRRHAFTERDKIILTVARLAGPERYKGYEQ